MGYSKEAFKGISWLGSFRLFTRALSFLRTIVIARVLSPSQFGVYGIAALVLSFVEVMTETGINVFLVQKKESIDKYINTAWVVSIVRGLLISLAIFISSFFIPAFFNSPNTLHLLLAIAFVPLIRGFINPSVAIFQKNLQFHKEFYYRSSIFLIETMFSIILVLILKDPIALIYGLIAGAIFEVGISFKFVSPAPTISFNLSHFKEIISKGKWVTGAGITSYLFQNGDNVVVGRMLGTTSLGIYDMAYNISMLPISEITDVVARVMFPVYVRISDDVKRLRKAYFKTSLVSILVVSPIILILLTFPKELILLFLGESWIDAEPILRILAVFAFLNVLSMPTGAVFFAVGKQKYLTALTTVSLVVMLVSIIPLVTYYGLVGAAISVVISAAAPIPLQIYLVYKILFKKEVFT